MTTSSAQAAFLAVQSQLSTLLVSDRQRQSVAELLSRLPAVGGAQYLECRLGSSEPQPVDFLVAITKFQREDGVTAQVGSLLQGSGFDRLLPEWRRPGSVLNEVVPVAWLEFDDVERQIGLKPSVCVSVVPSYVDMYAPIASQAPAELIASLHASVLSIRGRAIDPVEQALLDRCATLMPPGAHWIHLSVMTARSPVALKLYGSFPEARLTGYLDAVGWQGDRSRVERALARYFPTSRTGGTLYVDLPFSELLGGEPGLGLCFSQQQVRDSQEQEPSRRKLLTTLVDDALCSPEQARALVEWPGVQRVGDKELKRLLDLKLVLRPGQAPLLKAYLGFSLVGRRNGFSLGLPQHP